MSEQTPEEVKPAPQALFQTKDINLAAYLKMEGYLVGDLTEQNGKVIFGFVDKDRNKRQADVQDFYNNKGGFLAYTNAWKDFKSMVYNVKKDKES